MDQRFDAAQRFAAGARCVAGGRRPGTSGRTYPVVDPAADAPVPGHDAVAPADAAVVFEDRLTAIRTAITG